MRTARFLVVVLALSSACKSQQQRHLESVELDWNQTVQSSPTTDEQIIQTYQAFLHRIPATHPLGNPHAQVAQERIHAAQARLDEKRAKEAKAAEDAERARRLLQEALLPIITDELFKQASAAEDIGRDAHLIRLRKGDMHLLTRGVFIGTAVSIIRWLPENRIHKVMGGKVHDCRSHSHDPKALERMLDAAFLPPDTPILGTTTTELFPVFRRQLRNQLRLYRGVETRLMPRLEELERQFRDI